MKKRRIEQESEFLKSVKLRLTLLIIFFSFVCNRPYSKVRKAIINVCFIKQFLNFKNLNKVQ